MVDIPEISVVIPNYNGMPYLQHAVESITLQTFRNLEIIVVDDGSDDGSRAYLESVSDPRLRVSFGARRGQAHAMNRGLELSRASLVACMHSDDISLPRRLE